jgi:pimeloyl-ACP methyl ester carboxylesterase
MQRREILQFGMAAFGSSLLNATSEASGAAETTKNGNRECDASTMAVRGKGSPIIFSHGFMMDRTMFAPQLDALSQKYRAIAYDSRARTANWRGPYDLYDLADDCVRVMDCLGIDRSVVAGMSMGGWMALRLALRHPSRVSGLVLIDTTATADDPARRAQFVGVFEKLIGQKSLPPEFVDWVIPQMFGVTTSTDDPGLVARWRSKFLGYSGDAVYNEAMSFRSRDDISYLIGRIKVPVLILQGEEDKPVPRNLAEALHSGLPQSKLVLVPKAGHTSNLENAPVVNDSIEQFMGAVYSS